VGYGASILIQRVVIQSSSLAAPVSIERTPDICDLVPWVNRPDVHSIAIRKGLRRWIIAYRWISRSSDERSLIATPLPLVAAGNSAPIVFFGVKAELGLSLIAVLDSFVADYAARQKLGGANMTFGIMSQHAVPGPDSFEIDYSWLNLKSSLSSWLLPRVLELIYTAWDLEACAADCCWFGPPFRWDEIRRFILRCEIDAALFCLYLPFAANGDWLQPEGETEGDLSQLKKCFQKPRDAVAYVMDTFPIIQRADHVKFGDYLTKRTILEIYDAMVDAVATCKPYQTRLDPPPADPSCRHPKKKVGILAFGSLIHDPGEELEDKIVMRIKTQTPFPVEYGRYSRTRGGAPTLVPHQNGSPVAAEILVLEDEVAVQEATDMLWRRETRRTDTDETYTAGTGPNSVLVRQWNDDPCVSTVLYTDFNAAGKIFAPTAKELAEHAINSVETAEEGKDGITYLADAIKGGIQTPLTSAYRSEILEQLNTGSLEDALRKAKEGAAARVKEPEHE
jgi:hypothetical protein